MVGEDLRVRTRDFGLRVIRRVESLPGRRIAHALGGQLLRAGTSPGANYRSACRAKSPADFISKMGTVEEELDESLYWMEMLLHSGLVAANDVEWLMAEADELLAITVASINTARGGRRGTE